MEFMQTQLNLRFISKLKVRADRLETSRVLENPNLLALNFMNGP